MGNFLYLSSYCQALKATYQSHSRRLRISVTNIQVPSNKLILENLPTRAKNFSLLPNTDLNVSKGHKEVNLVEFLHWKKCLNQ